MHNVYAYMEDIINKLSHYADTIESNPEELSIDEIVKEARKEIKDWLDEK